jgi:branched-chain amino acid transport system substrate-binding protein
MGRLSILMCTTAAFVALLASSGASAQYTDGTVKIGVLTDMSSVYSDVTGPGSVTAAKLAIVDFGGAAKGMKIDSYSPITRTSRT